MHAAHTLRQLGSRRHRGVTLVELVIAIVVVAMSVTAVLGVLATTSGESADALVRTQAAAIGNAYLEEVRLKPFLDPDGVDGEAARTDFDDVDDYDGRNDAGARDQFDTAIAGLAAYQVRIRVVDGNLDTLPTTDVKRIDVTVQHTSGATLVFTGYRTRYQ